MGIDSQAATPRLEDLIAEKLRRNPRALFVDQANYLREKSLGTVCYLWEKARIPVVLAGTKALYDRFTTSRLTEEVRVRLPIPITTKATANPNKTMAKTK